MAQDAEDAVLLQLAEALDRLPVSLGADDLPPDVAAAVAPHRSRRGAAEEADSLSDSECESGQALAPTARPVRSISVLRRLCQQASAARRRAGALQLLADCTARVEEAELAGGHPASAAAACRAAEAALAKLAEIAPGAKCLGTLRARASAASDAAVATLLAEHAAGDGGWTEFKEEWLGAGASAGDAAALRLRFDELQSGRALEALRRRLLRPGSLWTADVAPSDVKFPPETAAACRLLAASPGSPGRITAAAAEAARLAHAAWVRLARETETGSPRPEAVSLLADTVRSPFGCYSVAVGTAVSPAMPYGVAALLHGDSVCLAAHAELLSCLAEQAEGGQCARLSDELSAAAQGLEALAAAALEAVAEQQRAELSEQLARIGGFDPLRPALQQLPRAVQRLRSNSKQWQAVLPLQALRVVLGGSCELLCGWCIAAVLRLRRLSEDDAAELAELLSQLQLFEGLFLGADDIGDDASAAEQALLIATEYAPRYRKLRDLSAVLCAPPRELLRMQGAAELPDFTCGELRTLLCLLHADTEERQDALDELERRIAAQGGGPLWAQ
eukprot:TRINITY_DN27078_c0_g1_i1.p1 TRINITY_DN27078_c0_g1~~TRINITY_DN27078_c0_g1_i1.p1  ORF type:complete len:586 (+),score=199.10 TRINITY_DN27078_c0_g1_i1:75-1760(+)